MTHFLHEEGGKFLREHPTQDVVFRQQPSCVGPQCEQRRDHQLELLGVMQNELVW
jgi:hypothetical protein